MPVLEEELGTPGDLVKGAVLFAAWFQTNKTVSENEIRLEIETIAYTVIDELRSSHSPNSLLTRFNGTCLTDEQAVRLTASVHSSPDCKHILLALNKVLFTKLKFTGNTIHYYDWRNSMINCVLERRTGIPIILCVLYQAVAAKLGVRTLLFNFPRHFLLRWRQHVE